MLELQRGVGVGDEAHGTFAFVSELRREKSSSNLPKSRTRASRGAAAPLARGQSRFGLSATLASDCIDGIAFIFSTRATPDLPIESAAALFTTLQPIGVTAGDSELIWKRLDSETIVEEDESARVPLGPSDRERTVEIKLRSLLQSHSCEFDDQPVLQLRRRSSAVRKQSSHLFDYAAAASESDDKLRSRFHEALDSVVDGINELELELESHERPMRSSYTFLLTLACLRPVCGAMTREALAVEWRINALRNAIVAAPRTESALRVLATLTPRAEERNRKGRCDFRCRLAISFLANAVADLGLIIFDSNWTGGLMVLSDPSVVVSKPSEKSCVVAMRRDYATGVWALRGVSVVATLPAFAALIYVSTVTFQSDKGFSSFIRVIRYLRDERSKEISGGDCARRCWFNQATNVAIVLIWTVYVMCYLGIALVVYVQYVPQALGGAYEDVSEEEYGVLVAHAVNTSTPLFVGGMLDGPINSIRVRGGWAAHLHVWRIIALFALTSAIIAALLRLTQSFASLLAVLQITRGVGAKVDRTAHLMIGHLKHIVARLRGEKAEAPVVMNEIASAVAELEVLEEKSRLEALGMASQRWQAFIGVTLYSTASHVVFAACIAGTSFLPVDECYKARWMESDGSSFNVYDILTRILLPPALLTCVVLLYHVTIPNTRYVVLANRVKVEGERTMRCVVDWNERFGPNLERLLNVLDSDRTVALHSFRACGMSVDQRLFARVVTAFTAALVIIDYLLV